MCVVCQESYLVTDPSVQAEAGRHRQPGTCTELETAIGLHQSTIWTLTVLNVPLVLWEPVRQLQVSISSGLRLSASTPLWPGLRSARLLAVRRLAVGSVMLSLFCSCVVGCRHLAVGCGAVLEATPGCLPGRLIPARVCTSASHLAGQHAKDWTELPTVEVVILWQARILC